MIKLIEIWTVYNLTTLYRKIKSLEWFNIIIWYKIANFANFALILPHNWPKTANWLLRKLHVGCLDVVNSISHMIRWKHASLKQLLDIYVGYFHDFQYFWHPKCKFRCYLLNQVTLCSILVILIPILTVCDGYTYLILPVWLFCTEKY